MEEKGKNFIFMRLSATCVSELQLKPDTNFPSEVGTWFLALLLFTIPFYENTGKVFST